MRGSAAAIKEQKKRSFIAISSALLIHLIIFGAFLISHRLLFNDVVEYSGPVLVRLGSDRGVETPVEEQLPEVEERIEDQTAQEPETPVDQSSEQKRSEPAADEAEETEETIPVNREDNSEPVPLEAEKGSPSEDNVAPPEPARAVIKGSEEGNAYETTFDAVEGLVGRTWSNAPINLYMPLPYFIDSSVVENMKGDQEVKLRAGNRSSDDKRKLLLFYYEEADGEYMLKDQKQPPFDTRVSLWFLLEDGGYDLKRAEYKDGRNPQSIIIEFSVNWEGEITTVKDVNMVQSSRYQELDEAVLYGFSRWSFYNKTDDPLKGRFTYRFDR